MFYTLIASVDLFVTKVHISWIINNFRRKKLSQYSNPTTVKTL